MLLGQEPAPVLPEQVSRERQALVRQTDRLEQVLALAREWQGRPVPGPELQARQQVPAQQTDRPELVPVGQERVLREQPARQEQRALVPQTDRPERALVPELQGRPGPELLVQPELARRTGQPEQVPVLREQASQEQRVPVLPEPVPQMDQPVPALASPVQLGPEWPVLLAPEQAR